MHISDGNVSENVNSTNVLQNHLISSTNVQVDRGSIERVPMDLPDNVTGEFKTYMDFRCITNTSSKQWELQQLAYTGEYGFRKIGDKYLVALGTGYTKTVGDEFHITLDSGIEFDVIVGDLKSPQHTDDTNRYIEKNGNITEFIVDTNILNETALAMGDVSYAGFVGKIIKIERMIE